MFIAQLQGLTLVTSEYVSEVWGICDAIFKRGMEVMSWTLS